jgi:hypothetical protein
MSKYQRILLTKVSLKHWKKISAETSSSLTKVTGEEGGMLENLRKMNLEDIVYWTYQAWEEIEQKK